MCSRADCHDVCGYVRQGVSEEESAICYVPNEDGVNNGILWYSNDSARLANGTYTGIEAFSLGAAAPISRTFDGAGWPYQWTITPSPTGQQLSTVRLQFLLNQFPSPLRRIRYEVRVRRAQIIDDTTWFNVSAFSPTELINTGEVLLLRNWQRRYLEVLPIVGNYFNTSGGVNEMYLGVRGFDTGDLMDVNYVLLRVYPPNE